MEIRKLKLKSSAGNVTTAKHFCEILLIMSKSNFQVRHWQVAMAWPGNLSIFMQE
jgi:hypothetical protein